ncbi:ALDH-like protein, partial [Hymenopellis radicata]
TSHALDIAREESSAIYAGSVRHSDTGFFVQPTVFCGTNNMRAVRQEIFGPVASIIKFTAENVEANQIAKDTEYLLAAAVFTENGARPIRVTHVLEAGHLFVNKCGLVGNGMPFGANKKSGYGRPVNMRLRCECS